MQLLASHRRGGPGVLEDLVFAAIEGFASGLAIWALIAALCSVAGRAFGFGSPPRAPESRPVPVPTFAPRCAPRRMRRDASSSHTVPRRRRAA